MLGSYVGCALKSVKIAVRNVTNTKQIIARNVQKPVRDVLKNAEKWLRETI
jgi:ribosomal protein S28E/S33